MKAHSLWIHFGSSQGSVVGTAEVAEGECEAARQVALATLRTLKRQLGDLDRVAPWLPVRRLANAVPPRITEATSGFNRFSHSALEKSGKTPTRTLLPSAVRFRPQATRFPAGTGMRVPPTA